MVTLYDNGAAKLADDDAHRENVLLGSYEPGWEGDVAWEGQAGQPGSDKKKTPEAAIEEKKAQLEEVKAREAEMRRAIESVKAA